MLMKFKVCYSPYDIRTIDIDSVDSAVRHCMIVCKRYGVSSFMLVYTCSLDKKKKYEYMFDLKRKLFCLTIRYAGAPLPLSCIIDDIKIDLSFLNDVKQIGTSSVVPDDDLPW